MTVRRCGQVEGPPHPDTPDDAAAEDTCPQKFPAMDIISYSRRTSLLILWESDVGSFLNTLLSICTYNYA